MLSIRETGDDRVLVADDNPISRRIIAEKIRKWGFEAVLATDSTEAWRILQERGAPSLAILDWEMPGLTGLGDLPQGPPAGATSWRTPSA